MNTLGGVIGMILVYIYLALSTKILKWQNLEILLEILLVFIQVHIYYLVNYDFIDDLYLLEL